MVTIIHARDLVDTMCDQYNAQYEHDTIELCAIRDEIANAINETNDARVTLRVFNTVTQ